MSLETLNPNSNAGEVIGLGQRNGTQKQVAQQQQLSPGSVLVDTSTVRNTYSLPPGAFPAYIQRGPCTISGSAGATLAGASLSAQGSLISGVAFSGPVTIGAAAKVVFVGCTFASVTVVPGGQANFMGGFFSGVCDNSGGSAADVRLYGCITAVPPVNVTVV